MFDTMAWDARQNARRHRQAAARRAEVMAQRDFVAEAKRRGVGDTVRARVDAHCGFNFCETVANAYS